MPTERIAMRRVREMVRLRLDAELSVQEVARRPVSRARRCGRCCNGSPPPAFRGRCPGR